MTGVMFLRGHDSSLLWIVSDVFFHDFGRFSTIFPRFELKIVFSGNKVEVENGIFFAFFGVSIIISQNVIQYFCHREGFSLCFFKKRPSSNRFPRFFHDLCQKSRNITKYQFLLIQPFLASNLDKKLVLRAGLEPTTLCLEGRCSIQLSYRSTHKLSCLPSNYFSTIEHVLMKLSLPRRFTRRAKTSRKTIHGDHPANNLLI